MVMSGQLKILHLEDSKIDAELIAEKLQEDGVSCTIDWVDTQDDFAARLALGDFDIILADYTLPSFDGLSALRMTRLRYPDVPFIFVSGTIGEDRAVDTFKNGATDYVLKGHLSRLVPSIRRSLKESEERKERKRAEEALREASQFNHQVIDSAGEGIIVYGHDLRYQVWNPFMERLTGLRSSEVIGKSPLEVFPFLREVGVMASLDQALSGEAAPAVDFPYPAHHPDRSLWIRHTSAPMKNTKGEITGVIATVENITARKQSENELQRLNRTLMAKSKSSRAMMSARDEAWYLSEVCRIIVEDCGHALVWIGFAEQNEERTIQPVAHAGFEDGYLDSMKITWSDSAHGRGPVGTAIRTGKPVVLRNILSDPAFAPWREEAIKRGYAAVIGVPLLNEGKAYGSLNIYSRQEDPFSEDEVQLLTDLAADLSYGISAIRLRTEQAYAEAELQASAQQWNNTFDAMNDAISIMDEKGKIVRCNKAMIQLLDKFPQDIIDHPCWEVVHHATERIEDCPFIKMKQSRRRETTTIEQSGHWFNVIADPIVDQSGKLIGGVHIMTDITKHRRFDEQLRESESKFRSLAEQSLVGTYIIQDGVFKYVNPRFAEMFGYAPDRIVGHLGPRDLAVPEDRHIIDTVESRAKSGEQASHYEARGLKSSGEVIHAEIFGSRAHYQGRPSVIGILLDITEKKKLETQLLQAQKMEAVGQLTGGIAHDFNNILSAIMGYASFLQMKMRRDDPLYVNVDQILASSERAANLTRSLLTFSRKQITTLAPVNVNDALRKVQAFLRRIIGEDVDLRSDLSPADLIVNADAGQLEQVLLNLATNARDAMPNGGVLTLRTEIADRASAAQTPLTEKHPGYAHIAVSDTGLGMNEATREKIFEPFFTTKELGRGTGLGLSMVYGIIKQHGGHIECASEPGKGTTFSFYLPLVPAVSAGGTWQEAPAATAALPRGSETILVVEDDEAVRTFTKIALESFGYSVIEAVDGDDAIEIYRKNRDAIRLVLCDVIMPKKSGAEVFKAIRGESPGARFLFVSGYPADIVHRQNLLSEGTEIVPKPITPSTLLKKVREALDRA